jgi:hypothetical protein
MDIAKDTFLWQAPKELDGWDGDGVLLPDDLYEYLVNRDGTCPYSEAELVSWLKGESEERPS